jgi:hypothetical protein
MGIRFGTFGTAFILMGAISAARAQEMEPRAFSPSPVGTQFVGVALASSSGDVLLDPSIPITDVHADVLTMGLGYGRSFGLAGRGGLWTIALPLARAHVTGMVGESAQSVRRQGAADLRVRASLNLLGGKALTPAEFQKAPRKTVVGLALTVQVPVGEYQSYRLINLGTHRWAFKPEVGVSAPVGAWLFEVAAGAWLFTNNDDFYPGQSTKRQDPLYSLQTHVAYTFRPRMWLAADATWYGGGEVTIDDGPPQRRLSNSRFGATYSLPVSRRHTLKFAASRGVSARTGSNFTTYTAAWQFVWLAKR